MKKPKTQSAGNTTWLDLDDQIDRLRKSERFFSQQWCDVYRGGEYALREILGLKLSCDTAARLRNRIQKIRREELRKIDRRLAAVRAEIAKRESLKSRRITAARRSALELAVTRRTCDER